MIDHVDTKLEEEVAWWGRGDDAGRWITKAATAMGEKVQPWYQHVLGLDCNSRDEVITACGRPRNECPLLEMVVLAWKSRFHNFSLK